MNVWIYVNTNVAVGDVDHLKVFATPEADDRWFAENDPEGVAFEYPVEDWTGFKEKGPAEPGAQRGKICHSGKQVINVFGCGPVPHAAIRRAG